MLDRIFILASPLIFALSLSLSLWDANPPLPVFQHAPVEIEVARQPSAGTFTDGAVAAKPVLSSKEGKVEAGQPCHEAATSKSAPAHES
jgi:hypothetical protein